MDIEKINSTDTLYTFYGIGDYVEFSNANKYCNSRSLSRSMSNTNIKFSGGTYADAVNQALTGNPELVEDLYDGVQTMNAMIEQDGADYLRDVTGDFFDVGDYLAGEPEVFWREDETAGKRQVVPVYINFGMISRIPNSSIRNRGVAIVALCNLLQTQGFIVDLNVVKRTDEYGDTLYQKIVLPTNPIDLDTLAFMVANPLMLRRLNFSIFEIWQRTAFSWGYGVSGEYDLPDIFSTGVSGFYFASSEHVSYKHHNYSSLENAKAHVLSMIEEFSKDEKQVIFG